MKDTEQLKIMSTTPGSDAVLICMRGPSTSAPVPSADGVCCNCASPIHFSLTASPYPKKMCTVCASELIADDPNPDMNVTETTLMEVFQELGIEDTPENRKHAQEIFTKNYRSWLR